MNSLKTLYVDLKLFSENNEDNANNSNANAQDEDIQNNLDEYNDVFGIKENELEEYAKKISSLTNSEESSYAFDNDNNNSDVGENLKHEDEQANESMTEEVDPVANNNKETTEIDYKALYEQQKEELEKLKSSQERYKKAEEAVVNNLQEPPQPQGQHNHFINNNAPQLKITPEIAKIIKELTDKKAVELSGLNNEEIEALEYADDSDINKIRYDQAKSMARDMVLRDIQARNAQIQNQLYQAEKYRQDSISDIQNFVKEVQETENYETIMKYVTGEYMNSLPKYQQDVIRQAYVRVNNSQGDMRDNMIIRSLWNEGSSSYFKNKQTVPTNNSSDLNSKMTQRNKMPRVSQIQESGSNNGDVWTIDKIKAAINTGNIDKIPKSIQKQIANGVLL